MISTIELFGTSSCPFTREVREQLLFDGREFVEYDVDRDAEARARMLSMTQGGRTVPVLAVDGRITAIGWQGRGCVIDA
jgi:glutaredoxin 3